MKIFLRDQQHKFKQHLNFFKSKEVMSYEAKLLTEKTTYVSLNTTKALNELDLDCLFNYQIFPNNIMSHLAQWNDENRKMKVGDTIVQQVYLPPTKILSQKIVFAVRINQIIDEPNIKGFSYETLQGHVEKGSSTFTIEQTETELLFKIKTFSKPGNILTTLLGPFFSLPYQRFCTKSALNRIKEQLEA